MKLLKLQANNFASYQNLDFDFENVGLALISGPTGSGKSTLLDAACWTIYGKTAKCGLSDDVRSWQGTGPTKSTLQVATNTGTITVTRVRGKQHENDLYFTEQGFETDQKRGKDLTETQKLLEKRLGVSFDLYATASYQSDFSPTSTFFLVKPKDRREVLEKIANLSLPVKLAEKASEQRKTVNRDLQDQDRKHTVASSRYDQLLLSKQRAEKYAKTWKDDQARIIESFERKARDFELEVPVPPTPRPGTCPTCGNKVRQEIHSPKPVTRKNVYLEQLETERKKTNPFWSQIEDMEEDLVITSSTLNQAGNELARLNKLYSDLSHIYDLSFTLRGELLRGVVSDIQDSTNSHLNNHFDGQFRVEFLLEDADKLEVKIQRNGYDCSYSQLSRGQRSILRLCFGVSVMQAAANEAGVHIDSLALDEPFDGLDPELKVKAYGLLEELSLTRGTVLVVDHTSELKEQFTRKYTVQLDNDFSTITEAV